MWELELEAVVVVVEDLDVEMAVESELSASPAVEDANSEKILQERLNFS